MSSAAAKKPRASVGSSRLPNAPRRPVALVIGASRGLGRQIAFTLVTRGGYSVGVAAKSTSSAPNDDSKLPGTVYSVCREINEAMGGASHAQVALPIPCNVLHLPDIQRAVQSVVREFGGIDLVVYNAGAIWWDAVSATPTKRYELMHGVNTRGCYEAVQAVLPIFTKQNSGRFVLISPPLYSRFLNGKTPYAMTKIGMTCLALGLAKELTDAQSGVSICTLWPATAVQSAVTDKLQVPLSSMRKDTIFGDAVLAIAQQTDVSVVNGRTLIDEDFLRETGTVTDFSVYRCDPSTEPQRMMPLKFPDLTVAEQDVATLGQPKLKQPTSTELAAKQKQSVRSKL